MNVRLFFFALVFCFGFLHTAAQTEAKPTESFLVVLDIQQHFTQNKLDSGTSETLIQTINSVIEQTNPQQVIYVKSVLRTLNFSFKEGFDVDTLPQLDFDDRLLIVNENIIQKNKPNAFLFNELTDFFAKNKSAKIIVVGLMAEHCVYKTLLGGKKSGYQMAVIAEAIAGKTVKSKARTLKKLRRAGVEIITKD